MFTDKLNPSHQRLLHLSLLTLFIIVAYWPSLDVPFIFDDQPNIVLNPAVHARSFQEIWKATTSSCSSTRPLAMMSFAFNYWLHGLDYFGYHVVNILIHIVNALLLYKIITAFPFKRLPKITRKNCTYTIQHLAFWSAALWAMNPIQTQAVTYIVQRMTSMVTFFYFSAILAFLFWRNKKLSNITAFSIIIACFFLGMACKEIAITIPFALLLLDWLFFSKTATKRTIILLICFIIIGVTLGFFYLKGGIPNWFSTYQNRNFNPWERVMTEWRIIWHYLSLYFLPLPSRLHLTYDVHVSRGILDPWTTLASLLALFATIITAFLNRQKNPFTVFGVLFYFLAISVESSFINLELAFVHRIYLPSAFLVFSVLVLLPPDILRRSTIILLLILAFWSYWGITRNVEWNQAHTFWEKDIHRGASDARAKNNRASALIDAGRFSEAIPILEQGLAIATLDNDRKMLLYNLGFTKFYQKKYDESATIFNRIAKEFGAYRHTFLFIGNSLLNLNRISEAERLAKRLSGITEIRYQGNILSAYILSQRGEYKAAEDLLHETIRTEQSHEIFVRQRLQLELARIYLKQNKTQEASAIFLKIIEEYPQNYSAWHMLYLMLEMGNDIDGARKIGDFLESKGVKLKNSGQLKDAGRS